MTNQYTLFTKVQDYYADLVTHLRKAKRTISMTCLAFEDGHWASQIITALSNRAVAGVEVRLMVDELGQLTDEPRTFFKNNAILNELRCSGIHVDVFNPNQSGFSIQNRMHCKFCAIDDDITYIGGSNVGDYYTHWSDTNLRVDGSLGNSFHKAYDYLHSFSIRDIKVNPHPEQSSLSAGNDHLLFTIPGRRLDIRHALLDLIRNADQTIHLRTWYFLPDEEILNALCSQARKGVQVNVLLSNRTRIRPVDLANTIHIQKLVNAGGIVHRYSQSYMHAKVTWNNKGTVLLGSANLDPHSMGRNFESCLRIQNLDLANCLQHSYETDLHLCILVSAEANNHRSLPGKMVSYACNLASPWL